MKQNYTFKTLLICLSWLCTQALHAQSIEDFETETAGSSTFTDNSQVFSISSTTGENYNVFSNGYNDNGTTDTCSNCGWSGMSADNKFIDNTGGSNNNGGNNGSNFTITNTNEFTIKSLYLYCATNSVNNHTGSLTIIGKKGGLNQFTITKNSGFNDVNNFGVNNGFTYIDFATEGSSDFTQINIDELEFTSTGNLDYMALDGFSWAPPATLSIQEVTLSPEVKVYPNPSSDYIKITNLQQSENYIVYDILGNKIIEGQLNNNLVIDIQNFQIGLYFIQFENENIIKFVKK
ncbi:T9SS type A sorting domain-containing protein [Olleya marilimosa]|uniref:T9SS type A sorting domain-containing protein n=1 Tax=Olleya marilimosa TaxID=272164 RepID=A0ABR8LYS4_9FLAO|nr:T9SS type A sorting domain-containing protein [Olleya marilimosa]MBD3863640.1 T9SS type A sorting domain-containing protein [Olleya marilimosa]